MESDFKLFLHYVISVSLRSSKTRIFGCRQGASVILSLAYRKANNCRDSYGTGGHPKGSSRAFAISLRLMVGSTLPWRPIKRKLWTTSKFLLQTLLRFAPKKHHVKRCFGKVSDKNDWILKMRDTFWVQLFTKGDVNHNRKRFSFALLLLSQ